MKKDPLCHLICFAILALPLIAQRTWHVDGSRNIPGTGSIADPFPSISAALRAVGPGDTILVAPWAYGPWTTGEDYPMTLGSAAPQPVGTPGPHDRVKLIARDGPEVTFIDPFGTFPVEPSLRILNGADGVEVRGFGFGYPGGFPVFESAHVEVGHPTRTDRGSSVRFTACRFSSELVSYQCDTYYGIRVRPGVTATIAVGSCLFSERLCYGIMLEGGTAIVRNCNFVGCYFGGVLVGGSAICEVSNSIFLDCLNVDIGLCSTSPVTHHNNCYWNSSGVARIFDCAQQRYVAPGSTDLIADPRLANRWTGQLDPTSPCIDAGASPAGDSFPAVDFAGDPRTLRGPTGSFQRDIGADEHAEASLAIQATPSIATGFGALTISGSPSTSYILGISLDEGQALWPHVGEVLLDLSPQSLVVLDPTPRGLSTQADTFTYSVIGLPLGFTAFAQAAFLRQNDITLTNSVRLMMAP